MLNKYFITRGHNIFIHPLYILSGEKSSTVFSVFLRMAVAAAAPPLPTPCDLSPLPGADLPCAAPSSHSRNRLKFYLTYTFDKERENSLQQNGVLGTLMDDDNNKE